MNNTKRSDAAEESIKLKDQEEARASHWLYSRRGPAFLDPIFRLFENPIKLINPYIKKGHVVADLGCGWGYYVFVLADLVGPEGKVYAVDLGKNCIQSIQKKVDKEGRRNIEAYASSASVLSFIKDRSVDFVFANGLLCSMAYDRQLVVNEIKRILKLSGKAYLSLGMTPPFGFVHQPEWEKIIEGFTVDKWGSYKEMRAVVSIKQGVA